MGEDYVVVSTTTDSAEAANQLARGIVDAYLGACVQVVGPIRSTYRWQGTVHVDQEWQCQIKTTMSRLDELTAHIRKHHSYDVPEVVATPIVAGSDDYLSWVREYTTVPTG